MCSNLAADNAKPLTTLLQTQLDAYVWSFEAGAMKPDPLIYAHACGALDYTPAEVLMVGDTLAADLESPRACGMQSVQLDRRKQVRSTGTLASLCNLMTHLDLSGCSGTCVLHP